MRRATGLAAMSVQFLRLVIVVVHGISRKLVARCGRITEKKYKITVLYCTGLKAI